MKLLNFLYFLFLFSQYSNLFPGLDINIQKLNNYENNKNYKEYLSSLNKVVYTVLLGNYDKIHAIKKEKGYDYFMFTDQNFQNERNLNWTILHLKKEGKLSKKKIFKKQRFYKMHPHLFFAKYDLSIYIDTSYEIKGKLDDFLIRILSPNLNIYLLEHPHRNNIFNEMKAVLFYKKDSKKTISFIKHKYKGEEFPDDIGLSENSLIVRKHNEKDCINLMNKWYKEIEHYSHRDQLSFGYILWKMRYKKVKHKLNFLKLY